MQKTCQGGVFGDNSGTNNNICCCYSLEMSLQDLFVLRFYGPSTQWGHVELGHFT